MKKFISIILTIIITFISFTQISYAARGELRYKITDMKVSKEGITFEGWAFIHDSHNYRTVHKVDSNGNPTTKKVKENGGQNVRITVLLDGSTDTKNAPKYYNCKEGKCNDTGKYNFFYEMFTRNSGAGLYGDNYTECYNDGKTTNCNGNNQYYYEDIGFSVSIPMSVIQGHKVKFKIAAYNNDFGNYVESNLGVTGEAIKNEIQDIKISNQTTSVEMMASYAQPQFYINDGKKYKDKGIHYFNWYKDKDGNCENNNYGCTFKIVNYTNKGNNYNGGYKEGSNSTFINGATRPGKYVLCVANSKSGPPYYSYDACSNKNAGEYCGTCNGETVAAYESWVNMPANLSITVDVPQSNKFCEVVNPKGSSNLKNCTGNSQLKAECKELTVEGKDNSRAEVSITQTGTISSVLTPDRIYAGGGFNLGIIYYNTISWKCNSGDCNSKNIENAMKAKLKEIGVFTNSINLTNVKFNGKGIGSNFFIKSCKQKGSFTKGNTLTTICTFFLPKSTIDNKGEVTYKKNEEGLGINNKYYTSLKDEGNYKINLTITGMDILKPDEAKKDSKVKNKPWTGTWEKTIGPCEIEIYSLLSKPDNGSDKNTTLTYKFLYRPINLNDPFPDRNAGVNWYEWYKVPNNKERLEESYSRLQYQITLDNEKVSEIKRYNSNHDYLSWDGIDPKTKQSKFVDEYFTTKRQNIVGDKS